MTMYALFGAIEIGLLFGLVGLGVYLSFRILNLPDLTVDGSFPLGAAVAAVLISHNVDPFLATCVAIVAGAAAGATTAILYVRLGILHLLASILVMIALFSINLRIMDRPNIALIGDTTVFTGLENTGLRDEYLMPLVFLVVLLVAGGLLLGFLTSQIGLAMRATGTNPRMAAANGIDTARLTILGMAISNGLVGLAGALFAQSQGAADVSMGIGTIVIGLASVIVGESILRPRTVLMAVLAAGLGSVLYRLAIGVALNADFIGLKAQDLNLITAVLVTVALVLPRLRVRAWVRSRSGRAAPITRQRTVP
jgi:putative ABC transport system permease protein